MTPVDSEPEDLAPVVEAAFAAGDVASILIRGQGGDHFGRLAESVMPPAFAHNVAVLLDDAPELAAEIGADGVQIPAGIDRLKHARAVLGADRIVGALCGRSRHEAMEMGEAGADYVAFNEDAVDAGHGDNGESMFAWWAALFQVPCVAYYPVQGANARRLIMDGVDFIRPSDAMWTSVAQARSTVRALNAMIDEIRMP